MIARFKLRVRRDAPHGLIETYLREINEVPLLTPEEEVSLGHAVRSGDAGARERMIRANLRLVVNIARIFTGKGVPIQDLIQEGNIGLGRAVDGFDPEVGVRFSTYATYWIRQTMRRAITNTPRPMRIPAYAQEVLYKWRKAAVQLKEELGRTPEDSEVADALGLPPKKRKVIRKALAVHRMDQITDSPDSRLAVMATIEDLDGPSPDSAAEREDEIGRLTHHLDDLAGVDERGVEVIRLRFGLDGGEPMTLKAIGLRFGMTRERTRQIEEEVLAILRARLSNDQLIPAARRRA